MVAAHGIQGNPHSLGLFYIYIKINHRTPLVFPATWAKAMGLLRRTALGTGGHARCTQGVM